jgi:hypothetical protein
VQQDTDIISSIKKLIVFNLIKWRRMRWAGHVARMGEKRNAYGLLWESQRERDQQEDQVLGGWIILGDSWRGGMG